jgi:YidC/Oxa1 family membrane protein insertase
VLNFIYYPVSAILWFWHKVFGYVLAPDSGVAWALSVVFLVFTLRALLFKPFVSQVRSMRKMQEFAPQIKKLQEQYGKDKKRMATEMQKLQVEHGVNPLGGCLPILVQIPVFIGLFHVLNSFNRRNLSYEQNASIANYVFSPTEVKSFLDARLLGAPLSAYITEPLAQLRNFGDVTRMDIAYVAVPLMIVAAVFTHLTARHSVTRQSAAAAANPQAAMMNKLSLYMFPVAAVVGGPFLPLAILIYWVSNNIWTLGQQYLVYHRIDREEAEKKAIAIEKRQSLGPKPGQRPNVKGKRPANEPPPPDAEPRSNGAAPRPQDSPNGDNGATPGMISDRDTGPTRGKRPGRRKR